MKICLSKMEMKESHKHNLNSDQENNIETKAKQNLLKKRGLKEGRMGEGKGSAGLVKDRRVDW